MKQFVFFKYANSKKQRDKYMTKNNIKIGIVGAGAAGMLAAGKAGESGADVTLFEKNASVGRKIAITGKGRCNLTNNCDNTAFIENVPTNPRFLYTAISNFSSSDTMRFFEGQGLPLKTERGNRVFPQSDRAFDVVDTLRHYCFDNGVRIINEKVTSLIIEEGTAKGLKTEKNTYNFDRIIVCTGGVSYPLTGSDGDGYRFAEEAGLKVITPKPSLVPLETVEKWVPHLMGLSLKNIAIEVIETEKNKMIYRDFGEMLFTHFGLSGPVILSASSHMRDMKPSKYTVNIDLKPALDETKLDTRLLHDFDKLKNKNYSNALALLLPQKMIPVFVELSGIPSNKKINSITRDERHKIIDMLKNFKCTVKGFRPVAEAIVTSGGVDVKELDPRTMQSKKVKGLYFAGEVIDVDAYTGGFNLQIAFCTAYTAAISAASIQ